MGENLYKPVGVAAEPQPTRNVGAGSVALQPDSTTAGMDYLNSLYTDPAEEERLRKASVMNQRILAVGDALRHIGNIAYTAGGAPAQQFSDPVTAERERYEKGKALRDRANQTYYAYQQQKAAQDAAQRKWEQQLGIQQANFVSQHAYRQEQARLAREKIMLQRELMNARRNKDEAGVREIEAKIRRMEELLPGEKRLQNARISQANASAASSSASAELTRDKKNNPDKYRSQGKGSGTMTVTKKHIQNPVTGGYDVVSDTTYRTPYNPGVMDLELEDDDMDLGLE